MSSPVSALLEASGIPADKLLTQRNSLPEPLQLLHRRTMLALAQREATDTRSGPHLGRRTPPRPRRSSASPCRVGTGVPSTTQPRERCTP
ncbi:hypothetical protein BN11_4740005 [Nostocoides australiense Ben110]|uniref:Uncharacterized protein n=1 Tax=Nostocoides australiense Ben110 TaxID=1193182 RepID=W6JZT6_9MICO|nr:hypothetical protein BN11_4740005 [Tetrasphaera australiensis Ben110]